MNKKLKAPEAKRSPVRLTLSSMRQAWIGVGVLSLCVNVLMLTGPLYMLQVYDRVITSQSMSTLVALSILMVLMYGFMGVLDFLRSDWEQSSLWQEVKIWKNASDLHGEKNSNSMVLLLDGLKGCQIIRHASLQSPQPTKQTIPQSIVLIWNKVASGWKWKSGKMPLHWRSYVSYSLLV